MTGQQTLDQLNALEPDPERPGYFKGYNKEHAWTHKTRFWDLPYFKDLLCPHNIDVMHTEKSIAEAIFGTLFGIEGKSKDNTKARVERKAELDEAKGMVQSWKASYEGNYFVGENAVDVPRWVCSKSKEGRKS